MQDFSLLHTFRGHEHKVMALACLDEENPLCISADSGGGIFVWGITFPFGHYPLNKWYEPNDWRYSGIHSLTVSTKLSLYTGSGDRSIRAWSLKVSLSYFLLTYGHKDNLNCIFWISVHFLRMEL